MSDNNINKIHHESSGELPVAAVSAEKPKAPSSGGVDPLIIAYMEIFKSMLINHDTAQALAKQLQANSSAQSKKIDEEAMFRFLTLSWNQLFSRTKNGGVKTKTKLNTKILQNMGAQNQEVSAIRGVLENQITVLRQSGQIGMTNLNTSIDDSQQSMQQGGAIAQMMTSLTSQIARI